MGVRAERHRGSGLREVEEGDGMISCKFGNQRDCKWLSVNVV